MLLRRLLNRTHPEDDRKQLQTRKDALESKGATLIRQYEELFANAAVCQSMRVIDPRSLARLTRQDLRDATTALGMDTRDNGRRDDLCQKVRGHYLRRAEILMRLQRTLDRNDERIGLVLSGDFCHDAGDFAAFPDKRQCEAAGKLWAPERPQKYNYSAPQNRAYVAAAKALQKPMRSALAAFESIIDRMFTPAGGLVDATLAAMTDNIDVHEAAMEQALRTFIAATRDVRVDRSAAVQLLTDAELQEEGLRDRLAGKERRWVQRAQAQAYNDQEVARAAKVKHVFHMAQAQAAAE